MSAFALMAASAQATTWALIHLEGESPNRIATFADIFGVTGRTDPLEMLAAIKKVQADKVPRDQVDDRIIAMTARPEVDVVQILENPDGPFARKLVAQFNCNRDTVTIARNRQFHHHNARTEEGPVGGPHPVVAPWVKQARQVGCLEKTWRAAVEADHKRGSGQTELAKLGMVLAVKADGPAELYDFPFDKLWKDGRKRELSSDRSPEETARLKAQALAQRERAAKAIDAVTVSVTGQIQSEDAERTFVNAIAETFSRKPPLQWRTMTAQAGWTERDLVDFWGVPQQVSELAGARVLVYRNESDERVTQNTVDMKSGQIVGSTTTGQLRQCELSLFLRPGGKVPGSRLVDFQMRGENCNIDTLGKNRPR